MSKKELNLNELENADNETVERLSESYSAVSDKDISRLFSKTEKLYRERMEESEIEENTVISNVEIYRKPLWHRILAAVSALILVAGVGTGAAIFLKNTKNKPVTTIPATDPEISEVNDVSEPASEAPFGDLTNDRIRFMTPAYAPCVYEISAEQVAEIAAGFNSATWEDIDVNTPYPDGESVVLYVYNDGQPLRLTFYGDNTAECERNGSLSRYTVDPEVAGSIYRAATPEDPEILNANLYWCDAENFSQEKVWGNNEPIPQKIFEPIPEPAECQGKKIEEIHPYYDYMYDITNIQSIADYSDNIVIGKVEEITYKTQYGGEIPTPITIFTITATEDINGEINAGERIEIEYPGGYISMRDSIKYILEMNDGKFADLTDEEIDNTYYREIIGNGELPIIGKEYAFFVGGEKGNYHAAGYEYGSLYKNDNIFIFSGDDGYVYYDLDDLKAIMNKSSD